MRVPSFVSSGSAEQRAQVADGLLVRLFRRRLVALGAAEGVLERHEHVVELGRLFVPALVLPVVVALGTLYCLAWWWAMRERVARLANAPTSGWTLSGR